MELTDVVVSYIQIEVKLFRYIADMLICVLRRLFVGLPCHVKEAIDTRLQLLVRDFSIGAAAAHFDSICPLISQVQWLACKSGIFINSVVNYVNDRIDMFWGAYLRLD